MNLVFIINMVSISMVMMAAIVLTILRDKIETQLIMSAVTLEAIVALASLMWIEPSTIDPNYLRIRMVGRTIEAAIMWYVIIVQVRGIRATLLSPNMTETVQKEIGELKEKVTQIEQQETRDVKSDAIHH